MVDLVSRMRILELLQGSSIQGWIKRATGCGNGSANKNWR